MNWQSHSRRISFLEQFKKHVDMYNISHVQNTLQLELLFLLSISILLQYVDSSWTTTFPSLGLTSLAWHFTFRCTTTKFPFSS